MKTSDDVKPCDDDTKMDHSEDAVAEKSISNETNAETNEKTNADSETTKDTNKDVTNRAEQSSAIAIPERVKMAAISKYGPSINPHFLLIEEIRKNKFGVNFEMSDEFRALFESQSEMMGRGLERLSKDLYR